MTTIKDLIRDLATELNSQEEPISQVELEDKIDDTVFDISNLMEKITG